MVLNASHMLEAILLVRCNWDQHAPCSSHDTQGSRTPRIPFPPSVQLKCILYPNMNSHNAGCLCQRA